MNSITHFITPLTKLEQLIRKLEINTGVEHKPSPFKDHIVVAIPPPQDKPEPIIQQQQPKQPKPAKPAKQTPEPPQDFGKFNDLVNIDIRIGEITKCWKHPESEKLYCEEINIGGEVRQIASGLQAFVPIEEMSGLVLVLTNLKGRKLAGFMSSGMVLCASNADHSQVEILRPAPGSVIGERVKILGHEQIFKDEAEELLNPKKKNWENAAPFFKTNAQLQATFDGELFVTKSGPIICKSLKDAQIS